MAQTVVWAFQPLPELKMKTGFVECSAGLAAELIEAGRAQNPKVGALCLKHITNKAEDAQDTSGTYATKVMTPEKRGPGRPRKVQELEPDRAIDLTDSAGLHDDE